MQMMIAALQAQGQVRVLHGSCDFLQPQIRISACFEVLFLRLHFRQQLQLTFAFIPLRKWEAKWSLHSM